MEPASIFAVTTACMTIVENAAGFIRAIHDLHARYRNVELHVAALIANTELLGEAAGRLRGWLDNHGRELQDQERTTVYNSISACERLVLTLRQEAERTVRIRPPGENATEAEKLGFRQKMKFLWRQGMLDRYAAGINNQVAVLNLYFTAFNP